MRKVKNLIYDVGLHKGEDTNFYLKKGYDVVSFEADPLLIAHCKDRFRTEIGRGKLRIVEGALAPASAGEEIAFFRSSVSVWGTVDEDWVERNRKFGAKDEQVRVKRTDMVECFQRFGVPYYLKIDVEGMDDYVLRCLVRASKLPDLVSMETSIISFSDVEKVITSLCKLGYRKFKCVDQSLVPTSKISTVDYYGRELEHVFEEASSGPFGDDIAGTWLNVDEIVRTYRRLFHSYRLFSHSSPLRRMKGADRVLRMTERITGRSLPGVSGWHDLHASL